MQAEIGAGLDAVGGGVREIGVVNAIGAAGEGSKSEAIDVAGADRLGRGTTDGEAEGITGAEAGVAAAGCLNGAAGIDDKPQRFGCGVGLDVAGEGQGDVVAGGEAAAIGAQAIGGEHRIGAIVDGAGDGTGVLGRCSGARGAATTGEGDGITAFDATGLNEGRNDVRHRQRRSGGGGQRRGRKVDIVTAADRAAAHAIGGVEGGSCRITLKSVVNTRNDDRHATGFKIGGGEVRLAAAEGFAAGTIEIVLNIGHIKATGIELGKLAEGEIQRDAVGAGIAVVVDLDALGGCSRTNAVIASAEVNAADILEGDTAELVSIGTGGAIDRVVNSDTSGDDWITTIEQVDTLSARVPIASRGSDR